MSTVLVAVLGVILTRPTSLWETRLSPLRRNYGHALA